MRLAQKAIDQNLYQAVLNLEEFSEEEVAKLTFAISTINVWNWISVSFRTPPGTKPPGV